jgi:hypothetical protein
LSRVLYGKRKCTETQNRTVADNESSEETAKKDGNIVTININ